MAKEFLIALLLQFVLVVTGFGLHQIFSFRKKIAILPNLPYAWGFGLLFLYVSGSLFSRMQILRGSWHWGVLAAAFLIIGIALWVRQRYRPQNYTRSFAFKLAWYEWFVVVLIAAKIIYALIMLMINPVFDGDAIRPYYWVWVAKAIAYFGYWSPEIKVIDAFPPIILPAWMSMFLPRWHDNLVSLPWFFTYGAIISLVFVTVYKTTRNRAAALMAAYLFSSVPLAMIHVIRPGYADLFVSYFFLAGIALITLDFAGERSERVSQSYPLLAMVCLGCLLTKYEGMIWALWLGFVWLSQRLHIRRKISFRKIISGLFFAGLISYGIYFLAADFIFKHVPMEGRLLLLFDLKYEPKTFAAFFRMMFWNGSFNLWWWFVSVLIVFLLCKKTSGAAKVMVVYILGLLAAVFYFACFTANVEYTLAGTNIGRILFQIAGVLMPLYVFFVKEILQVKLEIKESRKKSD